jgi:hypothetical protein
VGAPASNAHPAPPPALALACRQQNVEVMLQNIDKTEVLENKSAQLADQAKTFHKTARATKRHMCKQNAKMNLIIGCICRAPPPPPPLALTHLTPPHPAARALGPTWPAPCACRRGGLRAPSPTRARRAHRRPTAASALTRAAGAVCVCGQCWS